MFHVQIRRPSCSSRANQRTPRKLLRCSCQDAMPLGHPTLLYCSGPASHRTWLDPQVVWAPAPLAQPRPARCGPAPRPHPHAPDPRHRPQRPQHPHGPQRRQIAAGEDVHKAQHHHAEVHDVPACSGGKRITSSSQVQLQLAAAAMGSVPAESPTCEGYGTHRLAGKCQAPEETPWP